MCPNVFAFPIAMLGIVRAGAAQVNVNPLYTPRELAHQLNDAGAETIVIFGGSTPVLAEIIDETPVKTVITVDLGDGIGLPIPSPAVDPRLAARGALRRRARRGRGRWRSSRWRSRGDDILFFQYTGGTTGLSKGAVLTHRNLVANTEQFKAILPEASEPGREVLVLALPLYHIFGLMMMLAYSALGAKAVLIPNPRDMDGFIDAIKDARFSVIPGVNTLFQGLTAHPRFGEIDLSNYKVAIGGGAAVIEATSEKWKALTGHHIKEGYGLSETSPILCLNPMSVTDFTGTCGLPLPSTEIKLLDDDGNEVAEGEAGEICARGPQVMQGYWNNEAGERGGLHRRRLLPHRRRRRLHRGRLRQDRRPQEGHDPGLGLQRLPQRGRGHGHRLRRASPSAPASACADERSGEAVRVYAVKAPGADGLRRRPSSPTAASELAGYKVPKQIVFIDALPKSNVGKILRRELRTLA